MQKAETERDARQAAVVGTPAREGAAGSQAVAREETATDRLQIVLGREGLDRLRASTVMVLGLGGVGSNCVVALARGGVGGLVLVDRDVVGPSNINRQIGRAHV